MLFGVQIECDLTVEPTSAYRTLMLNVHRAMADQRLVADEFLVAHQASGVQHLLPGDHSLDAVLQFHVSLNGHPIDVRIPADRAFEANALVRRQLRYRRRLHDAQSIGSLHFLVVFRLATIGQCVHFAVTPKGADRGEREGAHFTDERSFARVLAFVLQHHALAVEALRAMGALEFVLFAMVTHVMRDSL